MSVEEDHDKVDIKNFLNDVREAIKPDDDAVTNNQFFDERDSNNTLPEGRCMNNLMRNNGLHYFKQTWLYILTER